MSRSSAQHIYAAVQELLAAGEDVGIIHSSLENLYRRFREGGFVVERDALVEVLDALEEEYPVIADQGHAE